MVKRAIANLEAAFKDVALHDANPEQYFSTVFDGLLGLYVGQNIPALKRFLGIAHDADWQSREDNQDYLPGHENGRLFSTLLAYIPDFTDPSYVLSSVFDTRPIVKPLADINFEARIKELSSVSHDGAIIWDRESIGTNYIVFDGLRRAAIERAGVLTGSAHQTLRNAVIPFIPRSFYNEDGSMQAGSKTLTGLSVPLAIPGSVTYVLKNTTYQVGIGRAVMCDHGGVSIEGYLERVEEPLYDEQYLVPSERIAIVRQEYAFDPKSCMVIPQEKKILSPDQLGLSQIHASI